MSPRTARRRPSGPARRTGRHGAQAPLLSHERRDTCTRHGNLSHTPLAMTPEPPPPTPRVRVGQAAEMLGVSVETLRRWETEGRLEMHRSSGGQRLVDLEEVARLLDLRRRNASDASHGRFRFPDPNQWGVVI